MNGRNIYKSKSNIYRIVYIVLWRAFATHKNQCRRSRMREPNVAALKYFPNIYFWHEAAAQLFRNFLLSGGGGRSTDRLCILYR